MSPQRIDRCVQSLMDDPNFKPREGKTKEESAWALCNWLDQQGKLKATGNGVENTMDKAEKLLTGPFRVVLPITGARQQIVEKADGGEEIQLWLHVEASGPERDADGDRFSEAGLEKMVEYSEKNAVPFLDGHYRDLLSAIFSDAIENPYLTEEKHFAFDVLLNSETNPFATQLFNDVLAGKRHGASIAGLVRDAEIEEYGEGEFGQIFNDVELLEVSRTSWPSYRDSFITLLANKVGKLPEAEFEAVMKRRGELERIKTGGGDEMLVKTADDGVEEWEENETGDLIVKITSPHGWDKRFSVSNTPWSDVGDRTKPCQYAIIKKNKDGTFSTSKSGYPHHMPGCSTINRGGVIAAAGRLVQALKSNVPAIETPPIVSLVSEKMGDEWLSDEQKARFSTKELKYAAKHILRHYKQDMDTEPPENLVDVAKTYDDEKSEIIDLIRGLVHIIERADPIMEVEKMAKEKEVVETPVVEQESIGKGTETVTETEAAVVEDTPVETQEPAPASEVVSETDPDEDTASTLEKMVDARLLASKFGELLYTMQEMVLDAVEKRSLDEAVAVLEDFSRVAKSVLTQLIESGPAGVALSFLAPFEERVEMATGQLAKSRVVRMGGVMDSLVEEIVVLRALMNDADIADDVLPAQEVPVPAEKSALEQRLEEIENAQAQIGIQRKAEMDNLAASLIQPKREQSGPEEEPEPVELSPEEKTKSIRRRFGKSARLE